MSRVEFDKSLSEHLLVLSLLHSRLPETCLLYWLKQENTPILIVWLGLLPWLGDAVSFVWIGSNARFLVYLIIGISAGMTYWSFGGMFSWDKENLLDLSLCQIRLAHRSNRITFSRVSSIELIVKAVMDFAGRLIWGYTGKGLSALDIATGF